MNIYVINQTMSSHNRLESSERLDEKSRKLNYSFKEATRKEIHAVYQKYQTRAYDNCLDFHGLHICKEEQLPEIIAGVERANEEMQAIDPSLYATLAYFSLDMTAIAKGETYGQVLSAIRYQVITEVLDRINEMTKNKTISQLSERSREALIKMVSKLKSINILDDAQITQKLDSIKEAIEKDSIEVMKKELLDEVTLMNKAGAFLKFRKKEE